MGGFDDSRQMPHEVCSRGLQPALRDSPNVAFWLEQERGLKPATTGGERSSVVVREKCGPIRPYHLSASFYFAFGAFVICFEARPDYDGKNLCRFKQFGYLCVAICCLFSDPIRPASKRKAGQRCR